MPDLNATPTANRVHIGIFGKRNAGKSALINAMTGQNLAIVSDVAGTTTDPVYKAMEILPMGPVVLIDTPGVDDTGDLGALRVKKSYQVLNKADIALLVVDAAAGKTAADEALLQKIKEKNIPYLVVMNKADQLTQIPDDTDDTVYVSALTGLQIASLRERAARLTVSENTRVIADLIVPDDTVVLVVPVDTAAPKGRLILPQQQTLRDILDSNAVAVVTKETGLRQTLARLSVKPKLVVTDSQAFKQAAADTPPDVLLTSFSILFARLKGDLEQFVKGAAAIDALKDGDTVLIAEGCTHHRQCDDIGSVKIPRWLTAHTGKKLSFEFSSGAAFPENLKKYALIVHCGGCMLNAREVKYRLKCAADAGVPVTNYGISIAFVQGILKRSLQPFPAICALLDDSQKGKA